MEDVTDAIKLESIKSFQSTIRKTENALTQMTEKGANITLVTKRLKALTIGLRMLEHIWSQTPHTFHQEDLLETRNILEGLYPSIDEIYAKLKVGSPQRTLLERRRKSLELAVQAIEEYLSN